jgi:hypothetical protein
MRWRQDLGEWLLLVILWIIVAAALALPFILGRLPKP